MISEATGFLYPFIDREERNAGQLLEQLAASAAAKAAVSAEVTAAALATNHQVLHDAAAAMAVRFGDGGRLIVFGNGGSATDAAATAELFANPPTGTPLPALSLLEEPAVLTALGNDVGFEVVFARQLAARCGDRDIAMGLSTSGGSANVLAGLREARRRGLLSIGLAGYDGGELASTDTVDHCLVVASDSVHRIQEAQAALRLELWSRVHDELERLPVGGGAP